MAYPAARLPGTATAILLVSLSVATAFEVPAPVRPHDLSVPADTSELVVFLHPGFDAPGLAGAHGLAVRHRLRSDPSICVVAADSADAARRRMAPLRADPRVRAVFPNRRTCHVPMGFTPNDPYFHKDTPAAGWPGQWHLLNEWVPGRDARVQGAWSRGVTGQGVTIGICDDSLQIAHPDLQPNYAAADSWDFGQDNADPSPFWPTDNHGTAVAGVAAARGGNGIGVTGAAPEANLAGLRIDFQNQTVQMFVDATLYHSSGADTSIRVKNHSYGTSQTYIPSEAEVLALADSAAAGTIHCFAAGNDRSWIGRDANTKDLQNSPEAICVAALGSDGKYATYSCFGACVFVTAPSSSDTGYAVTTTDRTGESTGYNGSSDTFPDPDDTSRFGGTSSAAPVASGVMALVRQVQPALDVRFAKHLLALTSTVVDAGDATVYSDGGWRTNAAGYHFNQNYGFGLIDADALTRQAVLYSGVTPLTTEDSLTIPVNAAIPDGNAAGITRTFPIQSTEPLEEMLVTLNITHPHRGQLEVYLISPAGDRRRLMLRYSSDTGQDINWTFCTNAFWGESPAGVWSVTVVDVAAPEPGVWNSFAATARMGALVPIPCPSPPAVASIDPDRGPNTAAVHVTIQGSNFVSGQTGARLSRPGCADILGTNVAVASPELLTCDFDLTGAVPGLYDVVLSATDCDDAVLPESFVVHLPPPEILAAASRKSHGTAGLFDIDVKAAGAVEPRQQGVTRLVVDFDRAVRQVSGTNADVAVTLGSVTAIAVDAQRLDITLAGVAGASLAQVSFPGIADASDASLTVEDTLCFTVLAGDVTGDREVSSVDLLAIRDRVSQTVSAGNCGYDVDLDGALGVADVLSVRNDLGRLVTQTCP